MKGLYASVESCLKAPLKLSTKSDLYAILLLYLFRGCMQTDVRSWLEENSVDFDFLTWRKALHRNGALLKNVKVFTYAKFCGFKTNLADYEFSAEESRAVNLALKNPDLVARLTEYRDEKRHPLGLRLYDRYLAEALTSADLDLYLRKFIRKKMSFLVRSYGLSASEIKADLLSFALFTLLKSYPKFDDLGHMTAIAKTAVKRRGVNLIKEQTTQKRQRLIHNADGSYTATNVTTSTAAGNMVSDPGSVATQGDVTSSYLVTGLDGKVQSAWEQAFSLKQLLVSGQITQKQRRFLSLLLGQPCQEFSDWLGKNNESVAENLDHHSYLEAVCEFMSVPVPKAQAFLGSLQRFL